MRSLTKTRLRDRRLQAISRYILRHGYSASEVASGLAATALQYTERDIRAAAHLLGLGDVKPEPSPTDGSGAWLSNGGGNSAWPAHPDHD